MYKISCLLILITLQQFQSCCLSSCYLREKKFKSILRGNYKNVISYENDSLLISRKQNNFNGSGRLIGMLFRNQIYGEVKGTHCQINYSIIIQLKQNYELNTLILWLWDQQTRYYNLVVYVSYQEQETVIFDQVAAFAKAIYINFPAQFVNKFRVYNRNGNSASSATNIIKAEAYYKV
ncbi:unnamed protein product [Paramecium sonneborni]|uniref:Uncharacterized protein n=1 Tax=Paramecium sonneborni TaxID=65129 RepID=A0A8S1LL62_9CILI|nr:unnamed protein product [Paramecium sonneborni]